MNQQFTDTVGPMTLVRNAEAAADAIAASAPETLQLRRPADAAVEGACCTYR